MNPARCHLVCRTLLLLMTMPACTGHRAAPSPDTSLPAGAVDEAEISPRAAPTGASSVARPTLPVEALTARLEALQRDLRRKDRSPAVAEQRLRELNDAWERTRRATETQLRVLKRSIQRERLAAERRGVGDVASAQTGRP
ncbi:MAG TPA: hypothetical protein VFH51_17520 [Myxococcota bacterium]|nr:hypothetical protein [Myxococcota bacterium]